MPPYGVRFVSEKRAMGVFRSVSGRMTEQSLRRIVKYPTERRTLYAEGGFWR